MLPASLKSLRRLGAIVTLAGLDLDMLGDQLPRAAVEVVAEGGLLRFEAEPALALAIGRDVCVYNSIPAGGR